MERERRHPRIEVLYVQGCPHYAGVLALVERVRAELGIDAELRTVLVGDQAAAERTRLPGSPTVRVDGRDVEPAAATGAPSLACRVYRHERGLAGQPAERLVRDALLAAARRRDAARVAWRKATPTAHDGVELLVTSGGQDWRVAWHPSPEAPPGTPHGSAAVCLAGDQVVLVSEDGTRWGLPGGRPEPGEDWADTLRREVREEACATVTSCRLLGFSRGVCEQGPEAGLVLVRSMWRAEVRLDPWRPRFEMAGRRLLPAAEAYASMWIEEGFRPIYRRIFAEAALPAGP